MILNKDKTNPDGIMEAAKNMLLYLTFLKEDKNEFGEGETRRSKLACL